MLTDNGFTCVATGATIGNRRIVRLEAVKTQKLRIAINAKASPLISNIEVY